jgi:AcrR family transcriptional regulator
MAVRRSAILGVARTMLAEKGVNEISLRELADRVGLAKSNVLRYFDSREAVFLEVMDEECGAWLSELDALLGRPRARKAGYGTEIRVATTVADSLIARPLLCELLGAMAGVLERNISGQFARDFKVRAMERAFALSELVARHLPWLPAGSSEFFAEGALTLTAGMYPFSVPTEPVRAAMTEMGFPDPHQRFVDGLHAGLTTWLIGAAAQSQP